MNANLKPPSQLLEQRQATDLLRYYDETSLDYTAWSKNLNMHFGYWRKGMWLKLEPMLEEMNQQVFKRLSLSPGNLVVDMGCGMGATMRALANSHPEIRATGLSRVASQVDYAQSQNQHSDHQHLVADYTHSGLVSGCADAAYALESSCHASGLAKADFLLEASRLLKPGGKLVVADGFLPNGRPRLRLMQWLLDTVSHNWAVESFAGLDDFISAANQVGLEVVENDDLLWRVLPSAMHVPRVTLQFLYQQLVIQQTKFSEARWGHVLASALSPFLGMSRSVFSYRMLTFQKQATNQIST